MPVTTDSLRSQLTMRIEACPEHIAQIQLVVRAHLEMWELGRLGDLAALAVAELLSNVYRHAEVKQATFLMQRTPDGVCIVVSDLDHRMPVVEQGRGLFRLTRLVAAWGIAPTPVGKDVWIFLSSVSRGLADDSRGAWP